MTVAVVDIGTNSTRLLIADVDAGRPRHASSSAARASRGSAPASTPTGSLADDAIDRVFATLDDYARPRSTPTARAAAWRC